MENSFLRGRTEVPATLTSSEIKGLSEQEIRHLIHELQVHQIELQTQNEELRRAQEDLRLSEQRYRDLFEQAPVGYIVLDYEGVIYQTNRRAVELLAREMTTDLRKRVLHSFCTPDAGDQLYRHLRRLSKGLDQDRCELNLSHRGEEIVLLLETKRVAGGEGPLRTALIDLTEQKRAESNLQLAAIVFEHAAEGIMVTDAEQKIISINRAFTSITGYDTHEVIGRKPDLLSSGRHSHWFFQEMWRKIRQHGRWEGEIWNNRKNGEVYPEHLSIICIRNNDGRITHYVGVFYDTSGQEFARRQLHRLAYYDELTGLPNRALCLDRLETALKRCHREGTGLALLFLDLDRFKHVNDALGHNIGDKLLEFSANLIRQCVRESDTVSRLGGDEFTVILNDLERHEEAALVAEKILNAFRITPFHYTGGELVVAASIGIGLYPRDADNVDNLLRCADIAMYRAKDTGRNDYQFYADEMSARFETRLAMETDLRRAEENRELRMVYQPCIDLETGRIMGAEALMRWRSPRWGEVDPAVFIPLAEETGLITPLAQWGLSAVSTQAASWSALGIRLSINLSGLKLKQLLEGDLFARIISQWSGSMCPIELELTETVLMEYRERLDEGLNNAKQLGITIAVDDFGTGYSSLSYLKQFPIDCLKIDSSFVRDVEQDPNDAAIAATIIAMARTLDLRVVAEGVETDGQHRFLKEQGCDEAQGFLFSPPLEVEEFERFFSARHQQSS
ncbi:MAG: EAL domain-containing protein [Gammaproteobacteria bacterium]|nr:EAL domain-containing protein [Gammaproteobacteria bacterium]MCP5417686.1 EAL domain-containing protein [Chromatiaceae bacterium]